MEIRKPSDIKKPTENKETKPETQKRLPKEVCDILNKQIQNEFNNALMYLASGMWLYKNNFTNGWKAFNKFSEEELKHMEKIINYMKERNCETIQPKSEEQKEEFKDVLEVLRSALEAEFKTTSDWENICGICLKAPCYTSFHWAEAFLCIQREEEKEHREFIRQFLLSEDPQKKDMDHVFCHILYSDEAKNIT